MKTYIITEGGRNIGFGHVARCVSLAEAFEERKIKPCLLINADRSILPLLKEKCYRLFNWLKKRGKLFDIIKGADIVIVDSYLADKPFYKKISRIAKLPVFFDDNKRLSFPAGTVLNPAIYADGLGYPRSRGLSYLLGARYIALRKNFRKIPNKRINEKLRNVMITFGGDDKRNMTPKIVGFLKKEYPRLQKNVVIGRGFANIKEINRLKGRNVNLIRDPGIERMRRLMLESDIAVTAAGQTLHELACVGTPAVGISIAKNQLRNAKGWQKKGFIEYAGAYTDRRLLGNLKKAIGKLRSKSARKRKSEAGMNLVDGKGNSRVARRLLSDYYKSRFCARCASLRDGREIFNLSNDSTVRENSFNTRKFGWRHHLRWFKEKLKDKNCVFLVFTVSGKFAGQIRFNMTPDGKKATVNFSLVKGMRGLGISSFALGRSIEKLRKMRKGIKLIKAYVKKDNVISKKSFKGAGFRISGSARMGKNRASVYTRKAK